MKRKHRKTLELIFAKPVSGNIKWADIEALFVELGAELSEREGSRIGVRLFGDRRVFHRPHPSPNTDKGAVSSIRKWLEESNSPHRDDAKNENQPRRLSLSPPEPVEGGTTPFGRLRGRLFSKEVTLTAFTPKDENEGQRNSTKGRSMVDSPSRLVKGRSITGAESLKRR